VTSRVFRDGLLDDQVAVVSGGGSGLGRAIALELAALGSRVVVCGRRQAPLAQTAALGPEERIDPARRPGVARRLPGVAGRGLHLRGCADRRRCP
jgi:NAD(P)-dependent dehydrogenase (short-subunit alcohol dehydrogenase family)